METTLTNPTGVPQAAQAPVFGPQNSALATPADTQEESQGADAMATFQPSLAPTIAKNTIAAGQINHGDARDWAENAIAGVTSALAGFGAGTGGHGAIEGIGAAARQIQGHRDEQQKVKTEQAQRQQQLDLEKQRNTQEQTNADRDYNIRLQENARQQAQSLREASESDARMRGLTDAHDEHNFKMMHDELEYREKQEEMQDAIVSSGGKHLIVGGKEAPTFDDLGEAEQYALQNDLGKNAHDKDYRTRPILGADNKWHIYEVPDTGPEWHTIKGPDGKPFKTLQDPDRPCERRGKIL